MKKTLLRIVSRIAAVTTVVSMFASFSPAMAATPTGIKDILSRNQMSATLVTHNLTATLPTGTWDPTETLIFTYGGFTAFTAVTPSTCTISSGTLTSCLTSGANVLTLTCATGSCGGSLVVTGSNWTSTNPSSAASNTVTITGTGGITGSFALVTVDSDQVAVTASVDPQLTFDLDVGVTVGSSSVTPYTVALGTMVSGTVSTSDAGSPEVNMIGADLATNASGGAVLSVRSANATGLASTSVPADAIEFGTGTITATAEEYGVCVNQLVTTAGTLTAAGAFDADTLSASAGTDTSTTCTATVHNLGSGTLSNVAQTIVSSAAPIAGGRAEVFVKASISAVTPAHTDYADTLTFVATATF